MNKEMMNMILKGNLDNITFTEKEKEIALKILNDLEGTLVIRATSILEFCLKAIQFSRITN
ncbi:hypothetical protein ACIR03_02465 [Clostridium cochlearium]|uniref:hypothetical protein n=1 Tax=Clostridium cochlearium TaxID=1494 RepID=UPI003F65F868